MRRRIYWFYTRPTWLFFFLITKPLCLSLCEEFFFLCCCSLQCRRFHRARANGFNRESAMLKLPKRGGNGASQMESRKWPSHLPSGLILLLSPIFLCHRIKDGGFIVAIRLTSFRPPKIRQHCRLVLLYFFSFPFFLICNLITPIFIILVLPRLAV